MDSLPIEISNIILLQLDFKSLNNISIVSKFFDKVLDESFWKNKYEQDFIKVNIKNMSWKELYFRASNVNKIYPEKINKINDIDLYALSMIYLQFGYDPRLKYNNIDDIIGITKNIINNCHCHCYCIKIKSIVLYNRFKERHEIQSIYEEKIMSYVKQNMKDIIDNSCSLSFYYRSDIMNGNSDTNGYWIQQITKIKDTYQLEFL